MINYVVATVKPLLILDMYVELFVGLFMVAPSRQHFCTTCELHVPSQSHANPNRGVGALTVGQFGGCKCISPRQITAIVELGKSDLG